ncbi:ribonuclease III [Alicyclobacillus tolerans]|uniref:ribonuclease III n=1 Tax=Alicyclobacillus tolerans TaxID=90970 RepID=UPI001F021195|nr:ribonuclease III [Alicyclobacillus tolerans]MCF8564394.1 ribonuclease III [Alicyclobacillus tolerans]
MLSKWDELQNALKLQFQTPALLKQAFTHASYRNEHRRNSLQDNERLEFLGDAVLELVVSEFLYKTRPDLPEGELTRLRASMVCEPSLVKFARKLEFHKFVRLGRGEERSGGRNRPALLADVFEAFIGALYLDQGLEAVRQFADQHIFTQLDEAVSLDYKTSLQEWVQQNLGLELKYETIEERGPAHAREFVVQVYVDSEPLGQGVGRSKKEAEQHAAQVALTELQQRAGRGM